MKTLSDFTKIRREGLDKLSAEAFAKLRKDAEDDNNSVAQCELALCYEHGFHLDKNSKEAFDLYNRAAKHNEAFALTSLGWFYCQGIPSHVPKDFKRAVECLERAASQGYIPAHRHLALRYLDGEGVEQDVKRAIAMLTSLVTAGYTPALLSLFDYYLNKQPDGHIEIAFNEKTERILYLVISILKQASQSEIVNTARVLFNQLSENHVGLPREWKRLEEYKTAARQKNGNVRAQFNLGWCYQRGAGVPQNLQYAIKFYKLAADQRNYDAQRILAAYYEKGWDDSIEGFSRPDIQKAVDYYTRAARQGNDLISQVKLARWYEHGVRFVNRGQEDEIALYQNKKLSVEFYHMAANQGHDFSQATLGWCYETGFGVQANEEQSETFYERMLQRWNREEINFDLLMGIPLEKSLAFLKKIMAHNKVRTLILSENRDSPDAPQIALGECDFSSDRESFLPVGLSLAENTSIEVLDLSKLTAKSCLSSNLLNGFHPSSSLRALTLPEIPTIYWYIGLTTLLAKINHPLALELTLPSEEKYINNLISVVFRAIQKSSVCSLTIHANFENAALTRYIKEAFEPGNTTITSLALHHEPEQRYTSLNKKPVSKQFLEAFSQVSNLDSCTLQGNNLHLRGELPTFLNALSQVQALRELRLERLYWIPVVMDPLLLLLKKHATSLSTLSLLACPVGRENYLSPEQAQSLMKAVVALPQLTSLRFNDYFFGPRRDKAGFDILSGFIVRKECVLRELELFIANDDDWSELFESPSFMARKEAMLKRNQSNQHNWMQAGFLISCMRANQGSSIATSVLPLIPIVTKLVNGEP